MYCCLLSWLWVTLFCLSSMSPNFQFFAFHQGFGIKALWGSKLPCVFQYHPSFPTFCWLSYGSMSRGGECGAKWKVGITGFVLGHLKIPLPHSNLSVSVKNLTAFSCSNNILLSVPSEDSGYHSLLTFRRACFFLVLCSFRLFFHPHLLYVFKGKKFTFWYIFPWLLGWGEEWSFVAFYCITRIENPFSCLKLV